MKKKVLCIIVATVVFVVGLCVVYYYYPRKVSFELAKEIDKPYPEFDRTFYVGFDYVVNVERFFVYMNYHYEEFPQYYRKGYDTIFVTNLAKELDFDRYDYIITYQKQLKELRYSPYLTKTEDGLYHDKRTPLIPTWDGVITDKVYIYRIKKNEKYRSPGP